MDYTNEFTTFDIYPSRQQLIDWVRNTGKRLGFVIIIVKSDTGASTKKPRVVFGCERSGVYTRKKVKDPDNYRLTGTKKCNCPFRLKGLKLPSVDNWRLVVVNGVHNYSELKHSEGHSYAGRLSAAEIQLVMDMHRNMSEVDDLKFNIKECGYFEWHRQTLDGTDIIKDIFWAHPVILDFLRTFPRVIILDCTYKTNRYKYPLLEIVGVTSTDHTFCIAIAYLVAEAEENYIWALERLKSIMIDCDVEMPNVFISDRELALMNAIEIVFPKSAHMLCKWHIKNNILTFMGKKKTLKEMDVMERKSFLGDWNELVCSKNSMQYNENLQLLHEKYNNHGSLLKYVHDSWLDPYKDRFVQMWTDEYMHFGNYTSNRAEAAHSKLKKHLATSNCNFEKAWVKMHSLLELSFVELKASFEQSLSRVKHVFHVREFKFLRGAISNVALDLLHSELVRMKAVGDDEFLCGCVIRKTHGLPYAHELARLGPSAPIPLDLIDVHWTRLNIIPSGKSNDVGVVDKMETLLNDVKKMDTPHQLHIYKKLMEVVHPQTSMLSSPTSKVRTKGRESKKSSNTSTKRMPSSFELAGSLSSHDPSSQLSVNKPKKQKLQIRKPLQYDHCSLHMKRYINQIPWELKPYVQDIMDVEADGNCGFRCVAALLGMGESSWFQVRQELYDELYENQELYAKVFVENDRCKELLAQLQHYEDGFAPADKWMTMLDMGYLVATKYSVVVISISERLNLTIPPLKGRVPPPIHRVEIAFAFVNDNHFVQVKFEPKHPVPPIISKWSAHRHPGAASWGDIYGDRRQAWEERTQTVDWN